MPPSGTEAFERIAGRFDYPMLIATCTSDGISSGCLVGFATQCSIDPPRFVVFLSDKNLTHRVALGAAALAVHVVPAEHEDLARLFGERSGDEVDKFALCEWEPGSFGEPLLARCPDVFTGRVVGHVEMPDHTGFVLEPVGGRAEGSSFFSFQRAKDFEPGHEA